MLPTKMYLILAIFGWVLTTAALLSDSFLEEPKTYITLQNECSLLITTEQPREFANISIPLHKMGDCILLENILSGGYTVIGGRGSVPFGYDRHDAQTSKSFYDY